MILAVMPIDLLHADHSRTNEGAKMEKSLNELVSKLKESAGANLRSVVLYGSAAAGDFHPDYSDLNVLCVLGTADGAALEKLNPAARWWAQKGHPAPLVFTLESLRDSADIFAIELLDIKRNRQVLFGEDVFAEFDVPTNLHRLQVEREMRTSLVRLRQHYLAAPLDSKRLLGLMTASVSTFVALFRHALIALGAQPPQAKRAVLEQLARATGLDFTPLQTVLDIREGKQRARDVNARAVLRGYLEAIDRMVHELERRLDSTQPPQP